MKAVFRGGTMKRTLMTLMILAHLAVGWLRPEAPKAIPIVGPSEAAIKEQVKYERKDRAYQKATRDSARVLVKNGCSNRYADIIGRAAIDNGIAPRLLAALVVIESHGNPNADDRLGSIGLTQVNSKTWSYSKRSLLNPTTNVRAGARILSGYIRAYGVIEGLHHYNGYSEEHAHTYVNKVLTTAGIRVY
jgi:soluble lytic murein transglycosylase-like protein